MECKLRCVNFRRVSDPRMAFLPSFRVTGISDDWYSSTMRVIVIGLGTARSTGDATGELNPNNQYNVYLNKFNRISICSFSPCVFQKLNLWPPSSKRFHIKPCPTTVFQMDKDYPSTLNKHSSVNSSNGSSPVFRYLTSRYPIFSYLQERETTW